MKIANKSASFARNSAGGCAVWLVAASVICCVVWSFRAIDYERRVARVILTTKLHGGECAVVETPTALGRWCGGSEFLRRSSSILPGFVLVQRSIVKLSTPTTDLLADVLKDRVALKELGHIYVRAERIVPDKIDCTGVLPELRRLDLTCTASFGTGGGVESLPGGLRLCRNIHTCVLNGYVIDAAAIETFCQMESLKLVVFGSCTPVRRSQIDLIQQRRPDCKIVATELFVEK